MQKLFLMVPLLVWQACRHPEAVVSQTASATLASGVSSPVTCVDAVTDPTPSGEVILQSSDGGLTWQDAGAGAPDIPQFSRVYADEQNLVLLHESVLYRQTISSVLRNDWSEQLVGYGVSVSNLFPGRAGLYAADYGRGLYKELPGTGIWQAIHQQLPDKTVRALSEPAEGVLLVGTESGIYRSENNGQSWRSVFRGDMVNALTSAHGVMLAGCEKGMLRSVDGGQKWELVLGEAGTAFRTQAVANGFITIVDGPKSWEEGADYAIYTAGKTGDQWRKIEAPFHRIHDVAQVGNYLVCCHEEGISLSADHGKTWRLVRPLKKEGEMRNFAVSGSMIFAVWVFGC